MTDDDMPSRLSSIEAIMWRAGHDATFRMTVGDLLLLDHAPARDVLVKRLEEAADKVPRLRAMPDDPSHAQSRPGWTSAGAFNAADHVHSMTLAAPGDERQLLDMVALLEPRPFDPDRPPWDVTLIHGLEGGRAGLYVRAHHALTDGVGGVSLMGAVFDQEASEAPLPERPPPEPADDSSVIEAPDDSSPLYERRRPGTFSVTIDLTRAAGSARTAAGTARAAASTVLRVEPFDTLVRAVQRSLETASSVSRQVVVGGGSLSSLPSTRSMHNRFEVVSVPNARHTAIALGGSRNDLLVAAAAAGLGAYQAQLGLSPTELRVAMPAGRHRDNGEAGNWFAPMRVSLPSVAGHPGPYFGVVTERLARARHEPALRLSSSIAATLARLPNRLLLPAVQNQARSVDFAATCFPGRRGAHAICGAKVEQSYPFGPRLGCLMNVTGFAIRDRLDVGITVDPAAIEQPELLVGCIVSAFEGFASAADEATKPAAPAASP
jgi:WS/DGAT/MGAT family acyltransferase